MLLASVVAGRPLIGCLYGWLFGLGPRWWADRRIRQRFAIVTLGRASLYALRAGVQAVPCTADRPEVLAVAKLVLGWPLTALAVEEGLDMATAVSHSAG